MKDIESILDQYEQEDVLSGAILISQDHKVIFEKAYGKASIQMGVPNTVDTKYHIASMTKMFIAAAALKLEEEGLLDLNVRPSTYMNELKMLHPDIKLHHLLNHTSGLQDIYAVPNLRYEMHKILREQGDFLTYLAKQEQLFHPGQQWNYNSTGFILMSYIMERVTGCSFEEVMRNYLLTPLSMNHTGHDKPSIINMNRACGHTIENGIFLNADHDRLSMIDAPGELYSTVKDLHKWCEALLKGEILKESSYEKMFNPYITTTIDPNLKYGYGWFLGEDFRLIGGGTPGFRSEIWQYPEEKLNIIMLWNNEKVNSFQVFEKINSVLFETIT